MKAVLLLMDLRPDPVGGGSWGLAVLLLLVVMVLAVGFAGGLVVLLIWLKRRKMKANS